MNSPEERSSPIRELLRLPDFLRLWLVGAFANAMRWLELLASGLFAYEVTGSALAVTAVVAVRQLPQLLFGAFAGAVSEAVNRKLIVMLALVVPAFVSTVLATPRHHRASRAVARGAGQPDLGHDVGDRDVDPAAHGGRGRGPAPHRPGDRARFGHQRRHAHDRPAAGRHRLPVAGHEGRLHADRPRAVRRRLRHGGAGPSAGHAQARPGAHPGRDRRGSAPSPAPSPPSCWCSASPSSPTPSPSPIPGLVAPLGLGDVPRLARPGRRAGRRRADRRAARRRADRRRPPAHGPPAGLRRRRGAVHGGADRDGAVAVLLARLRRAGHRRLRHGGLRQHADDPDADRGAARDALAPDGHRHGLHRHRAARRAGGRRAGRRARARAAPCS